MILLKCRLSYWTEIQFDLAWLSAEAEKATLGEPAEDGDGYLLDALTTAILRSAGIPLEEGEQNGHIDS